MPSVDTNLQVARRTLGQIGWTDAPYSQPHYQAKPSPRDGYANRVEIQRNEHDAILRFSREDGNTGQRVFEVTVPLSVLEGMVS